MANNRIAFGMCKKYGIELPKGAKPKEAWEALKKHGAVDKNGNVVHRVNTGYDKILENDKKFKVKKQHQEVLKSLPKRDKIYDDSDFPTIFLPKQEYAHIMSELATNMSAEQRKQRIVTKAIGDYIYTVVNGGFGYYRVIAKEPIEED